MRQQAHAIVLAAGSGSKMTSIVKHQQKCLLPIGNLPMIFYPLYMLRQAGFTEATVVVSTKAESEIKKAVDQLNLDIKVEYWPIDVADDPGTASILSLIGAKLKKYTEDVILLSSDIVSDVCLEDILTKHMSTGAMLTMLTSKADTTKMTVPGPKMKISTGMDALFIDSKTDDIKRSVADGDYDGRLRVSKYNLSSFKNPQRCFTASDNHLYILKRWVFDYILSKDSPCSTMISIKSEVIPHVIDSANVRREDRITKTLDDFIKLGNLEELISMYNISSKRGRYNTVNPDKKICQTFSHERCHRANKLNTYWILNKMMMTSFEEFVKSGIKRRHATANIHEKAQVCGQSFVGKKAIISEKTNITASAVGNQCKIQPFVRISDSVLFDQVSIFSGAVIEGSLICTPIDRKCTIKNCVVVDSYGLKDGHTYENEIIESNQVFS